MMKKVFCILGFAWAMIVFGGDKNIVTAQTPPTLAFYYAWFDDNTWVSGQTADIPAPTYRSADLETITRHVNQAQYAGIDAFVQSWYGPQIENNQTENNFRALLDIAQQSGFKAAVDVEVMSPFFADSGAVQNALATLMATHIHHPAYFRYHDKPVIFFWRQQRFSVETWSAIRQAVDPLHTSYWIAEGIDLSYQSVFDGHHLYSIAWADNPATELNKWQPRLQKIETTQGNDKLWIATAMPGYDDLNLHRADSFTRNRDAGAYYRSTWQAAQATNPDMIIITSFNEWLEGTQIEPSVNYGNFYLDLTRELVNNHATIVAPTATSTEGQSPPEKTSPPPTLLATDGVYVIKSGDTLLEIAIAFDVDLDEILDINHLSANDILSVGQEIIIPDDTTQTSPMTKRINLKRCINYHRIPEFY